MAIRTFTAETLYACGFGPNVVKAARDHVSEFGHDRFQVLGAGGGRIGCTYGSCSFEKKEHEPEEA